MNKIIKILIFLILIWLGNYTNANFQPTRSTFYFENKESKEIRYFETVSYTMKDTHEIALIRFINKTEIWNKNLFSDWYIKEVCVDKDCFDRWEINSWDFWISIYQKYNEEKPFFPNNKNNNNYEKFSSSNLLFTENINIINTTLFSTIVLPFLFFLPLNLIVFYCFWYLLYKIFFKHYKIRFFKYIYITSFFFYLISTILLYYFWYSFINFSTMWFGFMEYIFIFWLIKLILLFISKDLIKKYNEEEKVRYKLEKYIFYFYIILFIIIITVSTFNWVGEILFKLW